MANPSPTARQTPGGLFLKNGYQSLITFSADPDISLWEKSVTPPGCDGGDAIDTTTMHNVNYRVFAPRTLITMTESSFTAAYDPAVLTQIFSQLNREQTITVRFADGSTWAFYGFLRVFQPNELTEGEQPTAQVTIQPTNFDPTNRVEAGPALASVSGT